MNQRLPSITPPNHLVAWFWDDLIGRRTSSAFISNLVRGVAPYREWVLQFTNFEHINVLSGQQPGRFNAQVVFTETLNTITILYDIATPFNQSAALVSATIGLKDLNGLEGIDATGLADSNLDIPASDLVFIPAALPAIDEVDLELSQFSINPTSGVLAAGSTVDISVTVTNKGSMPSGPFDVPVYLSGDSAIDPSDELLGTLVTGLQLAPGASQTLQTSFVMPVPGQPSFAGRRYEIGVIADPANLVRDRRPANNVLSNSRLATGPNPYTLRQSPRQPIRSIANRSDVQFRLQPAVGQTIYDQFITPNMPFDFVFYGQRYAEGLPVMISTDGWIDLRSTSVNPNQSPSSLFSSGFPNGFVAPFWSHLELSSQSGSSISALVEGETPYRRWIIEFQNMEWIVASSASLGRIDFQAILYETTNVIEFRYFQDVPFRQSSFSSANRVSIGPGRRGWRRQIRRNRAGLVKHQPSLAYPPLYSHEHQAPRHFRELPTNFKSEQRLLRNR
jgi:hypothetical protein